MVDQLPGGTPNPVHGMPKNSSHSAVEIKNVSKHCQVRDVGLKTENCLQLRTTSLQQKKQKQSTRSLARKQSKDRLDYTKVKASAPQRDSDTMKADHGYVFIGNVRAVQSRRKLIKGAVTKVEAKRG